MANNVSRDARDFSPRIGAGVAGAGSGTVLVAFAAGLAADSPWKLWLQLAAPTVSVFAGAVVAWAYEAFQSTLDDYEERRILRSFEKKTAAAESSLGTSPEFKAELRKRFETALIMTLDRDLQRLQGRPTSSRKK